MSRPHRSGGKLFGGDHTTLIPYATSVVKVVESCPLVTGISIGFIRTGLKVTREQRVRISQEGSSILLFVRGTTSCQQIRVYSQNIQETQLAIARGARNEGLHICFKEAG